MLTTLEQVRFLRSLIRLRHNPTLFVPITRGPLHGFYHFFTGYFMPLYWHRLHTPNKKMAVVDSTPFNHWFSYLRGGEPEIVDRHKSLKLTYKARVWGFASGYRIRAIRSWDKWSLFHRRPLKAIASAIQEDFAERVSEMSTNPPTVVIFGRDHTPDYFRDNLPTRYGVAKRNIPNLAEVAAAVNKHIPTQLVDAATLSPEEVFGLCQGAQVLVAQHGAALTNAVFMQPGGHVVEIAWSDLEDDKVLGMYRLLSQQLGLQWHRPIAQQERFDPIDVDQMVAIITSLLK